MRKYFDRETKEIRQVVSFIFCPYSSVFHLLLSFLLSLVVLRDRFGKMFLSLSDLADGRGKMNNIRAAYISFRGGKKFLLLSCLREC